jgi:DHA2 family multidrug resistance protein
VGEGRSAESQAMLILARVLQGAGGGGMQPIAQAILLESFPVEKRGAAMAAYGMGVVVAPIIGPTLGGWITDSYSWRWIFYINLPMGILALFMVNLFVEDPPYIRASLKRRIDYAGFLAMALWLGSLQLVLDKGQEDDWFAATWICATAALSLAAMAAFIWRELAVADPIVNLRVLKNRNFSAGNAHHCRLWRDSVWRHRHAATVPPDPAAIPGAPERPGGDPARTGIVPIHVRRGAPGECRR